MENKIETLKDIRRQIRDIDLKDKEFDDQFKELSTEAMRCMEGINDRQEKSWIEKGTAIIDGPGGDSSKDLGEKDRALSYLKEAVNSVILREDNYRG